MANLITIFAPRWKDRTVLIADWKIGRENRVEITTKRKTGERFYPNTWLVSGAWLQSFPLKNMPHGKMREVPLDNLLEQPVESLAE